MPAMATALVLSEIMVSVPSGLSCTCVTRSLESSESLNWTLRPASGLVESMTASDADGAWENMASRVRATATVGTGLAAGRGRRKPWAPKARQESRAGSSSCMMVE